MPTPPKIEVTEHDDVSKSSNSSGQSQSSMPGASSSNLSTQKVPTPNSKLLGAEISMPPPPVPPLGSKKVPLGAGFSQHDWMILQKKEQEKLQKEQQQILSKTLLQSPSPSQPVIHPPAMRMISPEELALHDKETDVWIALRGHVYDITTYIRFHPGGVEQIMKGAGQEATAMFNAIHRYVNFETILRGKQVGIYGRPGMVTDLVAASSLGISGLSHRNITGESNTGTAIKKGCWGCKICKDCLASENATQLVPYTEFTQNESYLFLKVTSRGMRRNKDYWTVGILNREILLLKLITKPPDMWVAHFKLTDQLKDDTVELSFTNRYKNMILKLRKPRAVEWKRLGEPLQEHNEIEDSRAIVEDMYQGTVVLNEPVANTLNFMAIQLPLSAVLGVPVGWDIKVRHTRTSRRYTPVNNFLKKKMDPENTKGEFIYLVYRIYPDGEMTPKLRDLEPGDNTSMKLGCSAGNFDTIWLQGADAFFLLAAGSGITPYFRIIDFIVEHNIALGLSHVILIYWDRHENELVWKRGFEKLEEKHFWFQFVPVLTQADDSWSGHKGRISPKLLQTCMDSIQGLTTDKKRIRFMSCGSDGFNTSAFDTLQALGFHSNNLFTFLG